MRTFVAIVCYILCSVALKAQSSPAMPALTCGKLVRWEKFSSKYVDARNIDIWLPEEYDTKKHYPVLYMHDGQMLFDSNATWNHQSWELDGVLCRLMAEKKIRECIVVGVWNNGEKRSAEYIPQKAIDYLDENGKKIMLTKTNIPALADNYLKFLVSELKPKVDQEFSTLKDQKNTFIAGSSMGGLSSLYAICEYPNVFGGAACLSTHWTGIYTNENNPIPDAIRKYMEDHLPSPKNHRIYFDHGTATLDSLYGKWQVKVDELMRKKGFDSKHWNSQVFPGAPHTEKAWQERVHIPLIFLLERK